MGIRKDLTGQRFGRLVAIESHMDENNRRCVWLCQCDCGNVKEVRTAMLTSGKIRSCGCLHREELAQRNSKHGKSKTRLYSVWKGIKTRCTNPHSKAYKNYGGRGISICDEWANDFEAFERWAHEAGYNPDAKYGQCTIDRKDLNGDYSPENCRWVTNGEQANNKRNLSRFTMNGEEHTLTDWCRIMGIPKSNVQARLQLGWDFDRAITTPVRHTKK